MGFLGELFDKAKNFFGTTNNSQNTKQNDFFNQNNSCKKEEKHYTQSELEQKIANILYSDFSQYTVQRNVSSSNLGSNGFERKYTFLIYSDNTPVLAIMVTEHNRDKNNAFLSAKELCQKRRIYFANFFLHYPNEDNYIKDRLSKYLK